MSALEYAFVIVLLWVVFPLSINQMRVALDREDIEGFSIWVFISSFIAGLPFMVMTLASVS